MTNTVLPAIVRSIEDGGSPPFTHDPAAARPEGLEPAVFPSSGVTREA